MTEKMREPRKSRAEIAPHIPPPPNEKPRHKPSQDIFDPQAELLKRARRGDNLHEEVKQGRIDPFEIKIAEELLKLGGPPELASTLTSIFHKHRGVLVGKSIDQLNHMMIALMARAATAASASRATAAVPLFNDRNRSEHPTAEAFLRATYKGRLGQNGDLDQATLRKLDPALMAQLDIEFRGPEGRKRLRELLPTTSDRNDEKLRQVLGYVPEGEERRSALSVLARGGTPKPRP